MRFIKRLMEIKEEQLWYEKRQHSYLLSINELVKYCNEKKP